MIKVVTLGSLVAGDKFCAPDADYMLWSIVPPEDYAEDEQDWSTVVSWGGHADTGWIRTGSGLKFHADWSAHCWRLLESQPT